MGAVGFSKCRFDTSKCSECCEHLEALECAGSPDIDGRDSQALLNHGLLSAAREGQLNGIRHALDAGASIETRRPFVMTLDSVSATTTDPTTQTCGIGLTPLMIAAEEGYTLACELLISKRACVNSEDEDGMRPLHFAAFAGCPETCRALVRAGADPDALDADGRSALDHVPPHFAATTAERTLWKAVLGDPPRKKGGYHKAIKPSKVLPEKAPKDEAVSRPSTSPVPAQEPPHADAQTVPEVAPMSQSPSYQAPGQRGAEAAQQLPSNESAQSRPIPPAEESERRSPPAQANVMLEILKPPSDETSQLRPIPPAEESERRSQPAQANSMLEILKPPLPTEPLHDVPEAGRPTSEVVAMQTSDEAATPMQKDVNAPSEAAEPMPPQETVQAVEAPPQEPPQEKVLPDRPSRCERQEV